SPAQRFDTQIIEKLVLEHRPQVVIIPGWSHRPYRQLAFNPKLRDCKFILTLDNPWNGTIKQHLARVRLHRLISRVSALLVAGERAWQFARRLSGSEQKIYRGVYGLDMAPLSGIYDQRL